ncbi:MAG: phosphate acetyltransferase [Microbacteriaceae bacterium]|nr:phosphate acetyltransferase [Microbacteriaceae bacterium]
MSAQIYITSIEGRTGRSAIALGVIDTLLRDTPRLGIFRPLVRTLQAPDRLLELLLHRAHSDLPQQECVGVTYEAAQSDPEQALTKIVAQYKKLQAKCDAVVIVGSDFSTAMPNELAFNARIAANLDAPVLLIVSGRSKTDNEILGQLPARSPHDLAVIAEAGIKQLREEHARVLATVVNRADGDRIDEIVATVGRAVGEMPVWALPENALLHAPQIGQVLELIGGTLERGNPELLTREVMDLVIAGMSMENILPRLTEGAAVVVAADRAETLLAVVMAHEAPTFPTISGIVLNGEFPLSPDIVRLLDGIDSDLPVIRVNAGTFAATSAIVRARGKLNIASHNKLNAALAGFRKYVNTELLRSLLEVDHGGVRTPIMFAYELFERAAAANAHIVLPEGNDDRVLRAASTLLARGTARLTLLGDPQQIAQRSGELGLDLAKATLVDPVASPLLEEFAAEYARLRAHKGVTIEDARDRLVDVSYFGTMMVHLGYADGMVSGAKHTTAHTIKPSFEIIKTKPDTSVVSSVFFMALRDRVLVYGDCAVNPDPTAEQLADIAISSAATAAQFGVEPRIAMLSYSTGTSGAGADVDKVREATQIVQERRPDLLIAGPIQYDAAADPNTGAAKLPGSEVAGRATVFVFPDLNTGNNTYKAVQRSAQAVAVGPVLQGLNKPVNDLSRGASVVDILNTVAITAVQAGEARALAAATGAIGLGQVAHDIA